MSTKLFSKLCYVGGALLSQTGLLSAGFEVWQSVAVTVGGALIATGIQVSLSEDG